MLPSSQPDLWSEGGRGKGRGKGRGGLRDPSLTLAQVSPPESHPAELGDFQRQFLLTSQLSWASGLLIRLVNTTRTAGGGGRDPSRAPQSPPQCSLFPRTACLWAGTSVRFDASVTLPGQGLCVCLSHAALPLFAPLCPCPEEGESRKRSQP